MNVLLVSQCDKRALTATRRIVDQFAVRHGTRTWQTPMTAAGLEALHRLLRAQARKNTAIACHRIRREGGTELLWIVGDRRRFGPSGEVPTDTTTLDVLRAQDEDHWRHGALMRRLVELAGLLHDLGKAIVAFQSKLQGGQAPPNLVRHEWVSLRLWQSFVGSDDDAGWLQRVLAGDVATAAWTERLIPDVPGALRGSPFSTMAQAPLARAIGWLVVTHHRLPAPPDRGAAIGRQPLDHDLDASWNEARIAARPDDDADGRDDASAYWRFDAPLPSEHPMWRRRAARVAKHLIAWRTAGGELASAPLNNPHLMHLARLALMLADHHYSTLVADPSDPSSGRVQIADCGPLLANTKPAVDGRRVGNQPLVEHLVGVGRGAAEVAAFLPGFERHLPAVLHAPRLRRRESDPTYRWQNGATDLAASLRAKAAERGAFVVNLASTGCGKTLANAKIMNALADPARGLRCAFAIGLRMLTLQTGRQFRNFLGLADDQLAVRVGGAESRELFEAAERDAEATGSASSMPLIDDAAIVEHDGDVSHHPLLRRAVADERIRRLIVAPLLVCTVDHLVPATESLRGGRQIAPMLRLMSGDLVLDEVDDYDLDDLPALVRLVHWAGLLGAKVLLSSATLAPALVEALFGAYLEGRRHFERNVEATAPRARPSACCLWVDEDHRHAVDCASPDDFMAAHTSFADARIGRLGKRAAEAPRRRLKVVPMPALPRDDRAKAFNALAKCVLVHADKLHAVHHTVHPATRGKVSFGLIRMANIGALVDTARALFALGRTGFKRYRIHVCVYHADHPLLMRSAIERRLDAVLDRRGDDDGAKVFARPEVAGAIAQHPQDEHLFLVLGSPVTEVGRDHCYDWAIVEPSSMRSLIQLAGRVMRHRLRTCETPNIRMFATNVRHHMGRDAAAYKHPGFEKPAGRFHLADHDLSHEEVLSPDQSATPDARPRLAERRLAEQEQESIVNWVDLEHARLRDALLDAQCLAARWWRHSPETITTTGALQAATPFRKSDARDVELVLRPDGEDAADRDATHFKAWRIGASKQPSRGGRPGRPANRRMREVVTELEAHTVTFEAPPRGGSIVPWLVSDYGTELRLLADERGMGLDACALRYGRVQLGVWRDDGQTAWTYSGALGYSKKRD